ncbi:MAG: ATPase [Bacteroidales bacterium]|nr:ATPase [Bacteroidales bacterium]
MILIADSGSTKTDWVLIEKESGQRTYFEGLGLNPYYSDSKSISKEVFIMFESLDISSVSNIYFYGSGCSTNANKLIILNGLSALFTNSKIEVYHDLEGACRALCKTTKGIACILGTGSNAAYYNGREIQKSAISLGYILGDEGSGYKLGKKLIHAVYLKTAPENIIQDFQKTFNLTVEDLLIELYQKPNPNRFLASFTKYIAQNISNPFILDLVYKTFEEFLELVVAPLNPNKNLAVHFTGSIAWFFKKELEYIVNKLGFILGKISQKPIEDLADYHISTKTINNDK